MIMDRIPETTSKLLIKYFLLWIALVMVSLRINRTVTETNLNVFIANFLTSNSPEDNYTMKTCKKTGCANKEMLENRYLCHMMVIWAWHKHWWYLKMTANAWLFSSTSLLYSWDIINSSLLQLEIQHSSWISHCYFHYVYLIYQNNAFKSSLLLCLCLVSVTVINAMIKNNLKRRRFIVLQVTVQHWGK